MFFMNLNIHPVVGDKNTADFVLNAEKALFCDLLCRPPDVRCMDGIVKRGFLFTSLTVAF